MAKQDAKAAAAKPAKAQSAKGKPTKKAAQLKQVAQPKQAAKGKQAAKPKQKERAQAKSSSQRVEDVSGGGTNLLTAVPEPKYDWMNKSRQWGVRVKPGKKGLTLGSLNVGIYGEVPTDWPDQSRNPRGAIPRHGMPPVGYAVRDKAAMWADGAADLYEEAIQRRWAPATDVPWDSIEPLADDVEHAVCQVCTELCQYANVDIEAISSWQHQMAYGYHEVKQYLATATFDAARHYEAFRKRALYNGGGLGLEGPGEVNRMIIESYGGWTETVAYLFLLRGTFTMTMLRYLERFAHNDAERYIYARVIEDKARHLAYGIEHLQYSIAHIQHQAGVLATVLFVGDRIFARDLRDPVLREALAIIFGNGIEGARATGLDTWDAMMRDFMSSLQETCAWLGIPRSAAGMPEAMRQYLPPDATADAAGVDIPEAAQAAAR